MDEPSYDHILVATHLSSLGPPSPSTIVIQSSRPNASLDAEPDTDLPNDHATSSSILNTSTTGTILVRVIHGGLMVELVSLSTLIPPLRFVFSAPVLPAPSLFLSEESELHLLLITELGSLYRIIVPIDGFELWKDQEDNVWPREYFIQNLSVEHAKECSVHAHGLHCVAVSLPTGILLRLDAEVMGYDGHDDEEWSETVCQHGSFLSSLTALAFLHSSSSASANIISMASHPWPTDINNIWTLSRDRTLRLWKAKLGCVAAKALPSVPNAKDLSASGVSNAKHLLLDQERQNLVKVFSSFPEGKDRAYVYVMVFIPTPSSTSGGFFCLLDTSFDQFTEVGIVECPKSTAHCHLQDFAIGGSTLYTLWDQQGQAIVESTSITVGKRPFSSNHNWKRSPYMAEPELTPAFMEEQLLSPGSLTEKFLEAVMKPGVFSSLTLQTALERYIEACSSIPGPLPPQLTTVYSSLSENIAAVVGCTVTLNRDPQTGSFQHANYWTALKRDWEGFIARCREIERSARWPLAISPQGPKSIIVIERERVGSLAVRDLPVGLRLMLEHDWKLRHEHDIFAIIWSLRSKLGPHMLSSLENRVVDIMHQEIAFSFSEILQDQARRLDFKENLGPAEDSWFRGRLQAIDDLDKATRNAIDIIGGFDLTMKREENPEEVELLNPPPSSPWLQSQSAAYAIVTIEARYDLCLGLIILLFFLSENLQQWDASLLNEVFAVFRGLAILRHVGAQPVEPKEETGVEASTPDDVVAQMRNMNVSKSNSRVTSKSSLLTLLVTPTACPDGIASASHNFLDASGVLRSLTPANATVHEIEFCNRVSTLGFLEVTSGLLSWLPRTPAATYLQTQVFLAQGRPDDAAYLLEKLAGSFGISNLTPEESKALSLVLPNSEPIDSQYPFYLLAADLFRNTYVYHEVNFARLAIQTAPPGADTTPLWTSVVKGYADLALYDDAYASAMVTPFEKERRELATQLALRMCEEKAVEKLMTFDFNGVANEVEAALVFKARTADPRNQPFYSKILYTWYTRRGDYRNASLTMYQRAQKLKEVINSAQSFLNLAEDQLDSLSVAVNALQLVDEKSAWVLMADSPGKYQKLSKHVPESKHAPTKHHAEIIDLTDMQYECVLLKAQIDIIKRDPTILQSADFRLSPTLLVMKFAQINQYTQAMATARSFKIDMTDLFVHLTQQCLRLTRNPGVVLQEDTSGWLMTDHAGSWQGTPADRGWRYLQQSLKRHDGPDSDYRYTKASFETILSVGGSSSSPPWLIDALVMYQPEYLIRLSLKYENISDAVNYTYALVLKSDKQVSKESSRDASTTWLPYALIDQVLIAADAQITPPQNLTPLKTAINNRIKRMQKLSQNVS